MPNTKKARRKEDRKRKEQESAEAIQRTKKLHEFKIEASVQVNTEENIGQSDSTPSFETVTKPQIKS